MPLLLQLQVFSISDLFNMHIDIASNFSKYLRNNRQVSCRNLLYVLKILRPKNLKNESTFLCTLKEVFLCTLYTHQSNLREALFHTISSILKMHDFGDTHGPRNMYYIIWTIWYGSINRHHFSNNNILPTIKRNLPRAWPINKIIKMILLILKNQFQNKMNHFKWAVFMILFYVLWRESEMTSL